MSEHVVDGYLLFDNIRDSIVQSMLPFPTQ